MPLKKLIFNCRNKQLSEYEMTPQEETDWIDQQDTLNQEGIQRDQEAEDLYQQIKALAQSAVGVMLNDLTQAQIKALLAVLLWKAGGVENDMTVAPLGKWATRRQ